ncbi:MAG: hypothetical protein ACYCSF_01340 [Acidimicrobiales bacterium]
MGLSTISVMLACAVVVRNMHILESFEPRDEWQGDPGATAAPDSNRVARRGEHAPAYLIMAQPKYRDQLVLPRPETRSGPDTGGLRAL